MKEPMSEKKDWTEAVPEFLDLPIGETTFQIVNEPYLQTGKYGDRLFVPTNLGTWRLSVFSPIARELKKWRRKLGRLTGCSLTVVRTGKDKDTRYSLKNLQPPPTPPTQRVETPPPGQAMLPVTPEEAKAIQEMRQKA